MSGSRTLKDVFRSTKHWLADSWPARAAARFGETDIMTLAAGLSFYTLFSLAPLILLMMWVTTALMPSAQEEFFLQMGVLAGPEVESTARTIVENAEEDPDTGSLAAIFGTLMLLFGASLVFAQLQHSLNLVFQAANAELGGALGWIRKRVLGMGVVFGLGFLLVVSMILHAVMQVAIDQLPITIPFYATIFVFVLYACAFAIIYRVLPDRPVGWKMSFLGGVITAALFLVGRWAIGLYMGTAAMGSAYGPAGGLVVLLIWIYYSAVVFLLGAMLTAMLDEHFGRIRPAQPW